MFRFRPPVPRRSLTALLGKLYELRRRRLELSARCFATASRIRARRRLPGGHSNLSAGFRRGERAGRLVRFRRLRPVARLSDEVRLPRPEPRRVKPSPAVVKECLPLHVALAKSSGAMSTPSIGRSLALRSGSFAPVTKRSIVVATSRCTTPARTFPGHHAIAGTRIPPSHVDPLPSRNSPAEPPACSMISHGPLSLLKTTSVFSLHPFAAQRAQHFADAPVELLHDVAIDTRQRFSRETSPRQTAAHAETCAPI